MRLLCGENNAFIHFVVQASTMGKGELNFFIFFSLLNQKFLQLSYNSNNAVTCLLYEKIKGYKKKKQKKPKTPISSLHLGNHKSSICFALFEAAAL